MADDGGESHSVAERVLRQHVGRFIHLFLCVLAVLLVVAALIATWDFVTVQIPLLWRHSTEEYRVLQELIQTAFLIGIAAELGLLLLYHQARAAVEVILLVIARKLVTPGISAAELLLGVLAFAVMTIVRNRFVARGEAE